MKKRRFLSLIVAMLMVMSSCLPVLAVDTTKNGLTYDDSSLIVTSTGTVTISDIPTTAERDDPSNPGTTVAGVNFSTYQIIYATYDPDDNTITYHLSTWAYDALVDTASNPTPAGKFATEQAAIDAIQASTAIDGSGTTIGTSKTEQTEVLNTLAAYIADNSGNEYGTTFTYNQASNNATATLPVGVYLVIPSAENMAFLNMMVSVNAEREEPAAGDPQTNNWTIKTVGATLKGNEVGINKYVEDGDMSQSSGTATTTTAEVLQAELRKITLHMAAPASTLRVVHLCSQVRLP